MATQQLPATAPPFAIIGAPRKSSSTAAVARVREEGAKALETVKAIMGRRADRKAEVAATEAGQEATEQAMHRRWIEEGTEYGASLLHGAMDGMIGRWEGPGGVPINPSLIDGVILRGVAAFAGEDSDLGAVGRGVGRSAISSQIYIVGEAMGKLTMAELSTPSTPPAA